MADLNITSNNGTRKRRSKTERINLRVDFTPMVDMNMLLITFFMFCTTLAAPQVMDIVMPSKYTNESNRTLAPESRSTTLLLGDNHQVYYYWGIPKLDDPSVLKGTDLKNGGLRNILLNKNKETVIKIQELKSKRSRKEISEKEFQLKNI